MMHILSPGLLCIDLKYDLQIYGVCVVSKGPMEFTSSHQTACVTGRVYPRYHRYRKLLVALGSVI